MSFLGLYRDPTLARVTSACDWRIADLVSAERPLSLYLVVPPSDISRTKPLIRLVLNQIGRRLTERLEPGSRRQLLLMLDEFPALGRLDFFETALAFLAGYGVRAFLIAQSLNQIVKAYGENNSILDNCHIRIAFASNDERTARRISDALGTATEQRAMRNYAGHRLAPWLAHVMVSRQETSRPLLTPGEVMQLDPADELVLLSGLPPIRARKLRYFEDRNFTTRVTDPPILGSGAYADRPLRRTDDWNGCIAASGLPMPAIGPAERGSDGGLSQELRPVARRRRPRPVSPEQLELLGPGDDEAEAPLNPAAPLQPLNPILAAHAANEGRGSSPDLVPSF
jgi:type IV secretion system protein VirD4